LPILILVLIRTISDNQFRKDAKQQAEPSVTGSNIITNEQLITMTGGILFINLDEEQTAPGRMQREVLNIPAESILLKNNLKVIRKHKGPILLYSANIAVSARIWMVMSQLGYRNIYILNEDPENEILKNKFRPDTLVRPELKDL
jgi:rhodanese-related sulfurtransferase